DIYPIFVREFAPLLKKFKRMNNVCWNRFFQRRKSFANFRQKKGSYKLHNAPDSLENWNSFEMSDLGLTLRKTSNYDC
ncbi:MAG: hypothetical protein II277_01990, partial [Bacteroidales bacterium]|nr:hypothetical protein [Bacteroidales bacterium]